MAGPQWVERARWDSGVDTCPPRKQKLVARSPIAHHIDSVPSVPTASHRAHRTTQSHNSIEHLKGHRANSGSYLHRSNKSFLSPDRLSPSCLSTSLSSATLSLRSWNCAWWRERERGVCGWTCEGKTTKCVARHWMVMIVHGWVCAATAQPGLDEVGCVVLLCAEVQRVARAYVRVWMRVEIGWEMLVGGRRLGLFMRLEHSHPLSSE